MTALLALALLVSAPDPCAPVEPAGNPQPALAAEYRAVARAEREAGRLDSAAAAYRSAATLDPDDGASRAALASLCRDSEGRTPFDRGLARFEAGDCAGALLELELALAGGDGGAALLAGICRYERGEDAAAARNLRVAEGEPATRDSARLFLGLLALREGRSAEAATLLDAAATDARLASLAGPLARTARRSGRWVISAAAEAGWDSNVDLAPGASAAPSGSSDGLAGVAAGVTWAPSRESGPHVRAGASLTEQFRLDDYDVDGVTAAAGWRFGRGRRGVVVEAGWDWSRLGGAPYVSAPRLLAGARTGLGAADAALLYELRAERFRTDDAAPYSGVRQQLEAELSGALGGGWVLGGAWRAEHDASEDPELGYWETGPRVVLRRTFGSSFRAALEAAVSARRYGAEDPVFETTRRDGYADLAVSLELDLSEVLTLRLACTARRATSNVDELEYRRIVPTLTLAWLRGLP